MKQKYVPFFRALRNFGICQIFSSMNGTQVAINFKENLMRLLRAVIIAET
jgi:hypothetical protein